MVTITLLLVLVVMVVVAQAVKVLLELQQPLTLVAVVAVVDEIAFLQTLMEEQVALESLLFATLVHLVQLAVLLHRLVVTPFIHSQLAVHLQLNRSLYGTLRKSS
jgi:hypothetical protein